nr:hypothetical protein [Tanacetum cinerariifolium]
MEHVGPKITMTKEGMPAVSITGACKACHADRGYAAHNVFLSEALLLEGRTYKTWIRIVDSKRIRPVDKNAYIRKISMRGDRRSYSRSVPTCLVCDVGSTFLSLLL